jgi:hypothetical protein
VRATRLLYRSDPHNKANVHLYIDEAPHLLALVRLAGGGAVAAYSEAPLSLQQPAEGGGLLVGLAERRAFRLQPGKRPLSYDPFYVIFGNAEFRLKSGELRFFSNLGIVSGYFDSQGCRHPVLTGSSEREVPALCI